jgi:hypothetical protein
MAKKVSPLEEWLSIHGYSRPELPSSEAEGKDLQIKVVWNVVQELCSEVRDLYSINFEDLREAGLKIGEARTLRAKNIFTCWNQTKN